jgi:AAA15 family ATPase/GTPase
MITEYQIANFKAFGSPQTLPIRPITLIFGPNSSGKSSLFQSLLMFKQTTEQTNKPDTTLLFKGDFVDLGSFRELIFNHDIEKSFSFKIIMHRPENWGDWFELPVVLSDNLCQEYIEFQDRISDFKSLGMEIKFCYDQEKYDAFVSEISIFIGYDTNPLISYKHEQNANIYFNERATKWVVDLYKRYPKLILLQNEVDITHKYFIDQFKEEELKEIIELLSSITPKKISENNKAENESEARDCLTIENFLPKELNGFQTEEIISEYSGYGCDDAGNLSLLALAISTFFKKYLKNILYLGPQRQSPERYFTFSGLQTGYVGKSGENVLNMLISNPKIKDRVNFWFEKLAIGYKLDLIPLSSPKGEVKDVYSLLLSEQSNGVHVGLTDVGFGLSQVLPVIVQSVVSQEKTILIEQPEYHLHPRLQAELGDMFIESALGEQKNTFLIETHSEHLILRILRRIRETSEGTLPEGATPITPDQVSVAYVQPGPEGSQIIPLPITEDGEFSRPRPEGFFADRAQELM